MKVILLGLIVVFAITLSLALSKRELATKKPERSVVNFNLKDFPAHGISLFAPSDPAYHKDRSIIDPYSVILKNTSTKAIVGYSIKWECFDGKRGLADRDVSHDRSVSHIVSWVFLHGEDSERKAAIGTSEEIIKPNSVWLLSFDSPPRPLGEVRDTVSVTIDDQPNRESSTPCATVTVTADGVFFDDGTFVGPDTKNFFNEIKTQMDSRYEVLQEVKDAVESGKSPTEVFRGLENIITQEGRLRIGEKPTNDETRSYFRNLFARDVLGKKEQWGPDKTIQDIQRQVSKPWVSLRKL